MGLCCLTGTFNYNFEVLFSLVLNIVMSLVGCFVIVLRMFSFCIEDNLNCLHPCLSSLQTFRQGEDFSYMLS